MQAGMKTHLMYHKESWAYTPKAIGAAVGYDLFSPKKATIRQGEITLIDTGITIELPADWEGQVRGKSGMATKGIAVVNSPGTIDPDYRGTIGVILTKLTPGDYEVSPGDKIAQLVFNKIEHPEWVLLSLYSNMIETERGKGGFGSTGR